MRGHGGDGGRGGEESHLGLAGDQEVPGGDQQGGGGELPVLSVEAAESGQPALCGPLTASPGESQESQVTGEHPGSSSGQAAQEES